MTSDRTELCGSKSELAAPRLPSGEHPGLKRSAPMNARPSQPPAEWPTRSTCQQGPVDIGVCPKVAPGWMDRDGLRRGSAPLASCHRPCSCRPAQQCPGSPPATRLVGARLPAGEVHGFRHLFQVPRVAWVDRQAAAPVAGRQRGTRHAKPLAPPQLDHVRPEAAPLRSARVQHISVRLVRGHQRGRATQSVYALAQQGSGGGAVAAPGAAA